jgi:hypothetical protein
MMKRILKQLLICLLIISSLVSCSEYRPPVNPGGNEGGGNEGGSGGGNEGASEDAFTVSIKYNGEQYIPKASAKMKARWTDGFSAYVADFGEDGKASVTGLDGDYQVTLENLPEGYVYDPNAHVATNDKRDIVIEIYKPIRTSGYGTGPYDSININKTGVYRVSLTGPDHKVFFQYAPSESGTYSVESWVPVADGNYNPKADIYLGSVAYKTFSYTLDGGGVSSVVGTNHGYTKNFLYIVEMAEEHFSNGGNGGQAVFSFAVHVDSKDGIYPTYVDIAVKLNGGFSMDRPENVLVMPKEEFKQTPEYDKSQYVFVGAETSTKGVEGRYEFDGSMWRLFPKDLDINGDGVGDGDGYYHLYDEVEYSQNGGFGPILYAKINQPCRFLEDAFTTIEIHGNKALTVNGTENHKFFIEGLGVLGKSGYFCVAHAQNNVYCPCLNSCGGVCIEGCEKCHKECRNVTAEEYEAMMRGGYADYTNSDGVYAVTEELKHFLQSYSISQRMFADGNGWVEENPTVKVDASEEDQWLFACGYYKKIA